jgi:hypothetical protein
MNSLTKYQSRPIRFLEIYVHNDWKIKVYSISVRREIISNEDLEQAKEKLDPWLEKAKQTNLPIYNMATLIIHEGREGVFAILNWWLDENMLQNHVYFKTPLNQEFQSYSDNGIVTCVWELAVWWHERNAWLKHVLMQNEKPDFNSYLNDQLNTD